jgi:hypothetical protein
MSINVERKRRISIAVDFCIIEAKLHESPREKLLKNNFIS